MSVSRRDALVLGGAVAAGGAATWWLQSRPPPARRLEMTPVVRAVLGDRGSPHAGADAPDVAVVVFTDYQCGICKATDGALSRLLAADPGVRVVYKDWPIRGPESDAAARHALAADRQGRYLPLHQALMALTGPLDVVRLDDAARGAGLDMDRLATDLEAHAAAIDAQLRGHALQAFSLGLAGTPAYLVGPYLIEGGLDDAALARAVRRARR
ncbi:MAG: disulfide bond formation protein DsbA [Phenylobacterium zucineum]|nr:MAG: disulfide bond formation protein DsbA [Phenylobacterium zucineum]